MKMAMKHVLASSSLKLFVLALSMLMPLQNCGSLQVHGGDSLPLDASLTGNQTLISKNGTFALGFFSPKETNNWYIAIWYAHLSEKTIVWVANRGSPLTDMPGALNLSRNGYLRLFDLEGRLIWSAVQNLKACRALILDCGNFVMIGAGNNSEIVWESFNYPTDTWLPGMKLSKGQNLTSWKSSMDPAIGPFSLVVDPSPGEKRFLIIYNNSVQYWSSGEWMDDHFPKLPELYAYNGTGEMHFRNISSSSMYLIYEIKVHITVRFIMHKSGDFRLYVWIGNRWSLVWSKPGDLCDVYDVCGDYGVCNGNNIQFCRCLEGFMPKDNSSWNSKEWWSSGCVRRSPLQCSAKNGTTDRFLEISGKSLPHEQAVPYIREKTLDGCQNHCLNNCSCNAFALSSSTPPICRLWLGSLSNLRDSSDSQALFVRLAASGFPSSSSKKEIGISLRTILAPAVGAFVAVLALFALFIWWRRKELPKEGREDGIPTSLPMFTYSQLQTATRNFKHKMGSGAFGSVFEGTLPDNTLVAVKKLDSSIQAEKQFRAEINTIGNVQHVNLVRLLGFCMEGSQRLLVYEHVSNGSLNSLLFGMSESDGEPKVLDWKTRFQIALGTAQALVYLHEKCKDRIIHCDIKPENILLDENLCPKLADFGLAKIMGRDFSKVLTATRGTRGYLAPEWIYGFPITTKVDVYSFGVTILEIITGRRNMEVIVQESSMHFFTTWAATRIYENIIAVVDAKIVDNVDMEEVRRAAMAGILCLEEDPDNRPTMVQVLQMLEGTMDSHAPEFQEVEEDSKSII